MAARARIVTNPVAGERLTWLVTGEQTGGRLARAEIRVHGAGRGDRVPRARPRARERFTVVRGRIAIDCGGELTVLGPGESLVVPAGVPRSWWNTRAGELCVQLEISHDDDAAEQPGVSPLARSGTLPVRWRSWSWLNESLTGSVRWGWR